MNFFVYRVSGAVGKRESHGARPVGTAPAAGAGARFRR